MRSRWSGVQPTMGFQATRGRRPAVAAWSRSVWVNGPISVTGLPDTMTQSARSADSRATRGPRPAIATGRRPGAQPRRACDALNSPAWSTVLPASRSSITSTASASAVNGRAGARPIGPDTKVPPTPSPATTRPGATSASEPSAAAVATGWRLCGLVMAGMSASRRVATAIAVSVTYRSRSTPSSASSSAAAPRSSAATASRTSSGTGRTACSQTPRRGAASRSADMRDDLLGDEAQAHGPFGSRDVLDDQTAQDRLGVLTEPADGQPRVARHREGGDDLVGDQGGAGFDALLGGHLADPGDIARVGAGMLVHHLLHPVQVVGKPGLHRSPRGLRVGPHRDHQRGRDVLGLRVTAGV